MKQCSNNQRNSCLEYIKQAMILFNALDNDTQSNDSNDISTRRTPVKVNQAL